MPELTPQQKQRLQDELTKYAKEGASDDNLRAFKTTLIQQYESQNSSTLKKKDSPVISADASVGFGSGTKNISQLSSELQSGSDDDYGIFDFTITADPSPSKPIAKGKPGAGFTDSLLKNISAPTKPFSLVASPEMKKNYEGIEKAQIAEVEEKVNDVADRAYKGIVDAEDLTELYNLPKGKELANMLVNHFVPELQGMGGGLDKEVFGNEKKWDAIAKAIQVKNRKNGVANLDENIKLQEQEIFDIVSNSKVITVEKGDAGGRSGGPTTYTEKISITDPNDINQYSDLISQLQSATGLVREDGKGKPGDKEKLLSLLQEKVKRTIQGKELPEEIKALENQIKTAITRVNIDRESGEDIPIDKFAKDDAENQNNFQTGLNYTQYTNPAKYKNVIRALAEKEKVADSDFRNISLIGQDINNEKIFREGADNPEAIGKEKNLDYTTRQDKKSIYAGQIGEYLKQQGFTNRGQFTPKQIKQAALNLGLSNKSVVDELAAEEGILFYDAIPKSGKMEAFVRGTMQPAEGIRSTIDALTKDDSENYLKNQQFDVGIGGQKVYDGKGQMGTRLASDRSNIWYDAIEGFGQFVPQVLLTKGIGAPLKGVAAFGASQVPRAALTATQGANIVNYGGTFISTYFQEYGSAYQDGLDKTGDPRIAKAMGVINGISAASFELFLPDTKIADKAAGIFRKNYAGDIIDVLKKGGKPEDILRNGKNIIEKFVGETLGIAKQEIKEEVGTNIVNYITESIFSPKTAADRDLANEVMETARATAVSMMIPAVLGGAGAARKNTDFTVNSLHSAAINFDTYKESLEKALIYDQITQEEFNKGVQLLSTHRKSISDAPHESSKGNVLSSSERNEYAYQETLIKNYKNELNDEQSDVAKKDIQTKIKKAQDIQEQILLPKKEDSAKPKEEGVDESWKKRVVSIEEEQRDLDEVVSSPEDVIIESAAKGNLEGIYSEMVKADPLKAKDVLLDLAKQKYGILEDGTEDPAGGRDISMKTSLDVDDAVTKAFPDKEAVMSAIKLSNKEQADWNELSLEEKRKLAVENLPDLTENKTEDELVTLANENSKYLLAKLRGEDISRPVELNPKLPGDTDQSIPNTKETTKAETTTQEGNAEKVAKLESEKDLEILREMADIGELEFIEEDNLPKEKRIVETGKRRRGKPVVKMEEIPNEELVQKQNDIRERANKLKDLLNCLTK